MTDELTPGPTEFSIKTFGTSQKDTAEEARPGAVCNIHNQNKQLGHGVLVHDQDVNVNDSPADYSKYCIITSTKVIEIENFNNGTGNNGSTYQAVFRKKSKSKTFHLQGIKKSIRKTDSGLVIIFVNNHHQDFQHRKKTCSILEKSCLTIANCDQCQQLFCYVAKKCYNVESGGEDGVYILKAANNNSGTSGESTCTNVPDEIQNGTVILQRAGTDVKAVGVFNVVDKKKMMISPIWLKSSIMGILEDSTSRTPDQPKPAPTNVLDGPPPDNAPDGSAAAASTSTTGQLQTPHDSGESPDTAAAPDGSAAAASTSTTGQLQTPHDSGESPDTAAVIAITAPDGSAAAASTSTTGQLQTPHDSGESPDTAAAPGGAAAAASTFTTDPPQTPPDSTNGKASTSPTTKPRNPTSSENVVPVPSGESPDTADASELHLHVHCEFGPSYHRERHPTSQEVLNSIAYRYLHTVKPSNSEEFNGFLHYLINFRCKVLDVRAESGSLIITLTCTSLKILDELWDDCFIGYLNETAQKFLVTEEILKEFGLKEVKLTTTIDVKEYKDRRQYFLELAVADKFISKVVTGNALLLDTLSKYLDRESRIIMCWKHLAYVLKVPAEERRQFDRYTEHSPTEDMFNYLAADTSNPDLKVKELKAKLEAIFRQDVIDRLNEGGYRDDMSVSDLVSSDRKFTVMLSSLLDSGTINNWKKLAAEFNIKLDVTEQFGLRGPGPTAMLFLHMSTAAGLKDLTMGDLRKHFEAMRNKTLLTVLEKSKCEDSSLVRDKAVDGSELLADIGKLLNTDRRGFLNWRNLAVRLKIPPVSFNAFDTSKGEAKSPTKMLFDWLYHEKSTLPMKDLFEGLKRIERYDVAEFIAKEAADVKQDFRKLWQIRRFTNWAAKEGTGEPLADLRKKAEVRKFRIVNNDGQGNCMFSALSHQLEIKKGEKKSARQLRTELVQYVKNHPTLEYANGSSTNLFEFVDQREYPMWPRYLEKMKEDGTWGDDVMITAAARHLNCAIRIISNRPDFEDILLTPDSTSSDGVQLVELVLGHIVDCHYVSLEPEH